jgi:hypothetical protein
MIINAVSRAGDSGAPVGDGRKFLGILGGSITGTGINWTIVSKSTNITSFSLSYS